MPSNEQGYNHILVLVCYLTKYVTARPLRTKTTKEVLHHLLDIYMTYGVPVSIQHDQGKEFTSQVVFQYLVVSYLVQIRYLFTDWYINPCDIREFNI